MAFLLLILIYNYQNQAQRADKLGGELNFFVYFHWYPYGLCALRSGDVDGRV